MFFLEPSASRASMHPRFVLEAPRVRLSSFKAVCSGVVALIFVSCFLLLEVTQSARVQSPISWANIRCHVGRHLARRSAAAQPHVLICLDCKCTRHSSWPKNYTPFTQIRSKLA